jgi:hypothetical protein
MKWLVLLCCLTAGASEAACRQALVLGLDVSGSVDSVEYQMQRDGVAAALTSPAVTEVLLKSGAAPVDLAVFEWSGPAHQVMIQPWVTITDAAVLLEVARRIRTNPRVTGSPTTAIGSAMGFGVGLLDQRANCWKRALDISGDGQANTGPRPQDVAAVPTDVVINGLVIEVANIQELSAYFDAYVIRGSGAFVEVALGFEDYAAAMERKLLRELQSLALSAAPDDRPSARSLQ